MNGVHTGNVRMTYPDGTIVGYGYDEGLRLAKLERYHKEKEALCITYRYDEAGRLEEKEDSGGYRTSWHYNGLNQLEELIHEDSWGILDRCSYSYDAMGNKTGIRKERSGRPEESGSYVYTYDALNRLERAWDNTGKEAEYFYNGLGQRTGRRTNEKQEDYLLDLTRAYHNLLGLETGEERQNFYWDFGVAAMEDKDRMPRYYLQDELGSPLRVLYGNGNGNIYGYDEFGGELYEVPDPEKEVSNRYSRQGEGQPFGYTGYRYDAVGGTYFAQAREYKTELGRFTAEDVVRGNGAVPKTLNRYGYCWSSPFVYIDLNGYWPKWLDGIFAHLQFEAEFMAMYMYDEDLFTAALANPNYYGSVNVLIPKSGKREEGVLLM